jgi:hypothetical protein
VANTTYKLLGSVDVAVEQLAVVLDKHLPVDRKIGWMDWGELLVLAAVVLRGRGAVRPQSVD